jgi:hypothetical protein
MVNVTSKNPNTPQPNPNAPASSVSAYPRSSQIAADTVLAGALVKGNNMQPTCTYPKYCGVIGGMETYEKSVSLAPRVRVKTGREAWLVAVGHFGATLRFDDGKTSRYYKLGDLETVDATQAA